MATFPSKVTDVSVYPDLGVKHGIGPVVAPVITGASGTWTVSIFGTTIGYYLDLTGGTQHTPLTIHGKYTASGTFVNGGKEFQTPEALLCTETGKSPKFKGGKTLESQVTENDATSTNVQVPPPPYLQLGSLTKVNVTRRLGDLVESFIIDGTGEIIGTRIGTPHLMGVSVSGGKREGTLTVGMKGITITGTTKDGGTYHVEAETCTNAGDPAIFFRLLGS